MLQTAPSLTLRCRLTSKELEFSTGSVCYLRCIHPETFWGLGCILLPFPVRALGLRCLLSCQF